MEEKVHRWNQSRIIPKSQVQVMVNAHDLISLVQLGIMSTVWVVCSASLGVWAVAERRSTTSHHCS